MKNNILKRGASVLLALVMCLAFTVTSTVEADAASTKSFKVVSQENFKYTNNYTLNGETKKSSENYKYTYTYKNGLNTSVKYGDGKTVYTRNKKGYVTKAVYYDKNGKKTSYNVYTVKSNGDVKKYVTYSYNGSKATKESTTTLKYYSKGKIKQRKTVYTDKSYMLSKYDKNGNETLYQHKDSYGSQKSTYKNTLDKKGNPTKVVETSTNTYGSYTYKEIVTTTNTYTYNKKGLATKVVSKSVTKEDGKTVSTTNSTTTNTFDSKKNLTKSVHSGTTKSDGYTSTFKSTSTYKFKTLKNVPKKYWHLYQ